MPPSQRVILLFLETGLNLQVNRQEGGLLPAAHDQDSIAAKTPYGPHLRDLAAVAAYEPEEDRS
jgi:hypothetical protein